MTGTPAPARLAAMTDHPPVLQARFAAMSADLWCGRCVAVTPQDAAHLPAPELGAPRCADCGRWVGYQCRQCGAIGDERR